MMGWLVLAAGRATRFGGDKLMAKLTDEQTVIGCTIEKLQSTHQPILVVCRPEHRALTQWLQSSNLNYSICENADKGMGVSLAWGIKQVASIWSWCGIVLADMPFVQQETLTQLLSARQENAILVPKLIAKPQKSTPPEDHLSPHRNGHPVIFSQPYFSDLTALTGDKGAKSIINKYQADVIYMDCFDPGIVMDVDTRGDLENNRGKPNLA